MLFNLNELEHPDAKLQVLSGTLLRTTLVDINQKRFACRSTVIALVAASSMLNLSGAEEYNFPSAPETTPSTLKRRREQSHEKQQMFLVNFDEA